MRLLWILIPLVTVFVGISLAANLLRGVSLQIGKQPPMAKYLWDNKKTVGWIILLFPALVMAFVLWCFASKEAFSFASSWFSEGRLTSPLTAAIQPPTATSITTPTGSTTTPATPARTALPPAPEAFKLKGEFAPALAPLKGVTAAGKAGLVRILPPLVPPREEIDSSQGIYAPNSAHYWLLDGNDTSPAASADVLKAEVVQARRNGSLDPPVVAVQSMPLNGLPSNPRMLPVAIFLATDCRNAIAFNATWPVAGALEWWVTLHPPTRVVSGEFVESESFTIPSYGWKTISIFFDVDEDHTTHVGSRLVPYTGLSKEEIIDFLIAQKQPAEEIKQTVGRLNLHSPLPSTEVGYWGLYYKVNGKRLPIQDQRMAWRIEDSDSLIGKEISFGQNIPADDIFSPTVRPRLWFCITN